MPVEVRAALEERRLLDAYRARPAYQQNDYLGWIARARRPDTRAKRLTRVLGELEAGNVYMNMSWRPRGAPAPEPGTAAIEAGRRRGKNERRTREHGMWWR